MVSLVGRAFSVDFYEGGDGLNIAVCDDEQMYIDIVVDHLKFFSVQNCVDFENHIFTSPKDLLDSDIKFDMAILDVEMDEVSGLAVGEELRK